MTPEAVTSLAQQLPMIKASVEAQLLHPVGGLLQRLMKKYTIIFLIFDDIARQYGADAAQKMGFQGRLVQDIQTGYTNRRKNILGKITRSIIRSIFTSS